MLSSAFSPYARILATPGALAFSATGLVARIPISTVSLGIVLLVSQQTGSYGLAGAVSAVYVLANAVLAVLHGRLADRVGQARALAPAITVFGVAGVAVVLTVVADAPTWTTYAAAAVTGGSLPQVGSCVRARWAHVLRGDARGVQTAFALEAVVDEAVFITGPIIVTFLATLWHPAAGILAAVATGVVGTLALTAQRRTQPPVTPHDASTGPARRCPSPPWWRSPPCASASAASSARPRWRPSRSPRSRTRRPGPASCSPSGPSAAWPRASSSAPSRGRWAPPCACGGRRWP
ncbi:MFS transporter [Nocardioides zeae]